jgi:DNA repair exonuclease SbcCD ATPase subunit
MIHIEKQKIQAFRKQIEDMKSKKELLLQQKEQKEGLIKKKRMVIEDTTKARWVLNQVSLLTQKKFQEHVERLVTFALQSIYDRDLRFVTKFDIVRNKAECQLLVQEGNKEPFEPEEEMGGGILDVISFALRVVLWSLRKPRSRNVLYLDEPWRFIGKGSLLKKAVNMMKEVSKRLNLQMIINTHISEIAEMADKAWIVQHNGTYCTVNEINKETDQVATLPFSVSSVNKPKVEESILKRRRYV